MFILTCVFHEIYELCLENLQSKYNNNNPFKTVCSYNNNKQQMIEMTDNVNRV